MNFENKGKWLKEAQDKMAARDTMEDPDFLDGDNKVLTFEEELDNVPSDKEFEEEYLDEDPLDEIDEELTEGLYVDPSNYGNYDDLVDVIDSEGNPQKMTRHTYDSNKGSGEFKDAAKKEPEAHEEPAQNDFESFANDYAENEAKEIVKLQSSIRGFVRAEQQRHTAGYYRDDIQKLKEQQNQLLAPLAKQLVGMSKYDAANAVKDIVDKAEVPEKDRNNFGYMLANVPVDDSGKTLANKLGLPSYQFGDMIGKFYK